MATITANNVKLNPDFSLGHTKNPFPMWALARKRNDETSFFFQHSLIPFFPKTEYKYNNYRRDKTLKTLILLLTLFVFTNSLLAQETKIELPTNNNTSSLTVTGTDTDRKMKFFADGGFCLTGEYGKGTIPISGGGSLLMWYPGKSAFRAGYVDGTQWDDNNIGDCSFATGTNTAASGDYSTAMGTATTASGDYSTAMGSNSTAGGDFSTAMGRGTIASGRYSTAMGANTKASGDFSTAMGTGTTAQAYKSVAIGSYNYIAGTPLSWVSTDPLFVCGNGSDGTAPSNALTLLKNGNITIAGSIKSESGGFIFPDGTTQTTSAITSSSYWAGSGNNLYNTNSGKVGINKTSPIAQLHIGGTEGLLVQGSTSSGTELNLGNGTRMHWYPKRAAFRAGYVDGTQWDDSNIGDYSFASGKNTIASGDYSTAMGRETTASGFISTAMGYYTIAKNSYLTVVGRFNAEDDDALFIVGDGGGSSSRRNAFTVGVGGDACVRGDLIANELWTLFGGGGTEYRLYPSVGTVRYAVDTYYSDRRLKENVATIASPLQKIQQLRGVTYNWNSTAKDIFIKELKENVRPDKNLPKAEQEKVMKEQIDKKLTELSQTEISFIAQEVEAVFPEWVNEDENGYKKINMKGLNSLLVEAIKEQQEMIEELKSQKEKGKSENEKKFAAMNVQLSEISSKYQEASRENEVLGKQLSVISIEKDELQERVAKLEEMFAELIKTENKLANK